MERLGNDSMVEQEPFIVFGKPCIGEEEIEAVVATLRSGWIGMGPKCIQFEREFAEYVRAKHAISVDSCTAGLHLALVGAGVGSGDEVITTPLTFVATVNAIEYARARPVLVDVDPITINLDPNRIEAAITERTKAVLPVHFGGLACEMDRIIEIARRYHLVVIEDAAHAIGAKIGGRFIGGIPGSVACFSFYPNKNITSIEGGMITTDDSELARKIELMRLHGLDNEAWKRYRQGSTLTFSMAVMQGYKYNMTDVEAAIGICQLKKLEAFMEIRERYAEYYDRQFKDLPCAIPYRPKIGVRDRHALHLYTLVLDSTRLSVGRDTIIQEIRNHGIGATVHYMAVHLHPYFGERLGYRRGSFPISEQISEQIISLPLTPAMSDADAMRVAKVAREVIASHQTA